MKEVDCIGLSCPIPVVNTKRELKNNPDGLDVLVDNVAAKENVTRFAQKMGYEVTISQENSNWRLQIRK